MGNTTSKAVGRILLGAVLAAPTWGYAADWQITGLVREEVAGRDGNMANATNQQGNHFNGVAVPNDGLGPFLAPGLSPATLTRPASLHENNTWNLISTRFEVNFDGKLSDTFAVHVKLRGYSDLVGDVDSAFKDVNLFEQQFRGSHGGTVTELAGKQWTLDLPAAYLDYNNGPLWLRLGNQQIAWGDAIFFRVLDVPNGLDLRRHSILDVAAEEYSDLRVSSPSLRGSYRFAGDWSVEGFTELFQPTILPSANSPYNTIPAQFNIEQRPGYEAVKSEWNFGGRLLGKIGELGVQLMATHRRNPDGVFRWTDSKAGVLSGTPYAAGTAGGVYSAAEWFQYASLAGLDGARGLAASLNEFPATLGLGSAAVASACGAKVSPTKQISFPTKASATCVLDTFFDPVAGFGNLVGVLARDYPQENVFGFGANYIIEGKADSILDQLVTRFELSYTPNKKFTNPTLSSDYVVRNETQFALILEKNQKFSSSFPATYIVAQWLHKDQSDLFGRYLGGLGGQNAFGSPRGERAFNAAALAIQQPSPTLAFRTDLTLLTDFRGGWLIQPGVKWHPSKSLQFDLYANKLLSRNPNGDFTQNLMSANEVFCRGTVYF